MKESSSSNGAAGVGFTGALTIAFIVLKLLKVITWSWLWVLSPMWICAVIVILAMIIIVGITSTRKRRGSRR